MKKLLLLLLFLFSGTFIYAQDNVGIGTTSPADKLHIKDGNLRIENSFPALRMYQGLTHTSSITQAFDNMIISNIENGSLVFGTNGGNHMYLNSSGFLGLGTPSPQELFHITGGDLRIEETTPRLKFYQGATYAAEISSLGTEFVIANALAGPLSLRTNSLIRMFIDQDGDVGLGTISPLDKFHIKDGNIRIEETNPSVSFYQGALAAGSTGFSGANLNITNRLAGNISMSTSNTPRITIASDGKVGIGTAAPIDQLSVEGGGIGIDGGSPQLSFRESGTLNSFIQHSFINHLLISNTQAGDIRMRTNNTDRFTIDANGNVGIGTISPTSKLSVDGDLNFTGNLGVGTDTPLDKLHVEGGKIRVEDSSPQINFYQGATHASFIQHQASDLKITNQEVGAMKFRNNNHEALVISSSGKVGIGTITPQEKLTVSSSLLGSAHLALNGHNNFTSDLRFLNNGTLRTEISQTDLGFFITDQHGVDLRLEFPGVRINDALPFLKFYQPGFGMGGFMKLEGDDLEIGNIRGTGRLEFLTNDQLRMVVEPTSGNVGIGVNSPTNALSVSGEADFSDNVGVGTNSPEDRLHVDGGDIRIVNSIPSLDLYSASSSKDVDIAYIDPTLRFRNLNPSGNIDFVTNLLPRLRIHSTGDVTIGTTFPATGYRLSVDGKIISEELKVQMSHSWPDYVFEDSYDLMSLPSVKRFISEHKHLPGLPSANTVEEEDGIELGEMNRLLVEKVEELTLHMIRLHEEVEQMKEEIRELKNSKDEK